MTRMMPRPSLPALAALFLAQALPAFELKNNDVLVMVGPTLIERMSEYGYFENALLNAYPDYNLKVRNLGWSGDDVRGKSRGYDKPRDGYANLIKQIKEANPTVLLLAYGGVEAWNDSREKFRSDYQRLLDDLKGLGARTALLSPPLQEAWPSPMPDPAAYNVGVWEFSRSIKELCAANKHLFIDLTKLYPAKPKRGERHTSNSLHLNARGYRKLARHLMKSMAKNSKQANFDAPLHEFVRSELRRKNELFFHSWRPQNQTYLFSFRKHEQGRNAADLPKFLPYVEEAEKVVAKALQSGSFPTQTPPPIGNWEDIKPSAKALSAGKDIKIPDDLSLNLFASEPAIRNPTQCAWDERGRLWVATAESYPQILPGFLANDKIVVLEDTDGDGQADRRKVFAEGLLMPTAILPGHGGVYVGTSTQVLHLKDTNGDGKADARKILVSGLGTEDTHHIVHSLRHTEEGKIAFNQSIYINTYSETPWGPRELMKSGAWEFDPHTHRLEIFATGLINPWGFESDPWGECFMTDGAGGEGINHVFRGSGFKTSSLFDRSEVLNGLNPGQPKLCGLAILNTSIFPEKYRGLLVANDFRGHRTVSFRLSPSGSSFLSTQKIDLAKTGSGGLDRLGQGGMFRPIDVDVGLDGALYLTDWSNLIIQHGEVDFRDKRRDQEHGRIWRLAPKGGQVLELNQLHLLSAAKLLEVLQDGEPLARRVARRLLTEATDPGVDEIANSAIRNATDAGKTLELVWLLKSRRLTVPRAALDLLGSAKEPAIRVAALRLGLSPAPFVYDPHPRVRLAALVALGQVGTAQAAERAIRAVDLDMDKPLTFALRETLRALRSHWEGKSSFSNNPAYLSAIVELTGSEAPLKSLLAQVTGKHANHGQDHSAKLPIYASLARIGKAEHLNALYDLACDSSCSVDFRRKTLGLLIQAKKERNLKPTSVPPQSLLNLFQEKALAKEAILLGAAWKHSEAFAHAKDGLRSAKEEELRTFSRVLASFPAQGHKSMSLYLSDKPAHRSALVVLEELALVNGALAARLSPPVLETLPGDLDPSALLASIIKSPTGPGELEKGLSGNSLPTKVALAGVRLATISGRKLPSLIDQLRRSGKLPAMSVTLSELKKEKIMERVELSGDPQNGEFVYRRAELACVSCHAIGGTGPKVGPDLVSIGASAPLDYLIESLIEPNKKIKEGYHMTVVTTKEGKVIAGLMESSTKQKTILREVSGNLVEIAGKNVRSKTISPASLMPPGLTASLSEHEFVDLVRFLSELGKEGPYRFPSTRFQRTLRIPKANTATSIKDPKRFHLLPKERTDELLAMVNGNIPLAEVPPTSRGTRLLRFTIPSEDPREIVLRFDEPDQLELWADRRQVALQKGNQGTKVALVPGNNIFVISVAPSYEKKFLRLAIK